jgi:hypothetical protein
MTGIIGAIAGDCSMGSYDFHLVKHGTSIYKEPRFYG